MAAYLQAKRDAQNASDEAANIKRSGMMFAKEQARRIANGY